MHLDSCELVFLRSAPDRPAFDAATAERIQREHLAFLARLRESGEVVTNGPVLDPPDVSLRGLTFYRTGSLEETRRLAEQDPAVKAGALVLDVMTWWCAPDTMVKPGQRIEIQ